MPQTLQVKPNQICGLLQVPCKPVLTCFMVGLSSTKPFPPPGFLLRRVCRYGHPAGLKRANDRGAPCEPTAIHISCPTVSADVLLQLGYILLGDWWQALHSGHRKTLHSTKHTKSTKKNLKTHYMGVPPVWLPSAGQLTR